MSIEDSRKNALCKLLMISPVWAMQVSKMYEAYKDTNFDFNDWRVPHRRVKVNDKDYDISQESSCIVGEAHLGSSNYNYCSTCSEFSFHTFFNSKSWKEFFSNIEAFCDHFMVSHKK
ncbi:MAG: hypothetical protein ACRENO_08275 [Thermodesulfobacteriota bacterium]